MGSACRMPKKSSHKVKMQFLLWREIELFLTHILTSYQYQSETAAFVKRKKKKKKIEFCHFFYTTCNSYCFIKLKDKNK